MSISSRENARAWVRRYVRAAGELGLTGVAACFPISREQICAEDPHNARRLGAAPDFYLTLAPDGESAVLTWAVDGASERYPFSRPRPVSRSPFYTTSSVEGPSIVDRAGIAAPVVGDRLDPDSTVLGSAPGAEPRLWALPIGGRVRA